LRSVLRLAAICSLFAIGPPAVRIESVEVLILWMWEVVFGQHRVVEDALCSCCSVQIDFFRPLKEGQEGPAVRLLLWLDKVDGGTILGPLFITI
jgi:hypothetical protein